jgi:hypothetical protein
LVGLNLIESHFEQLNLFIFFCHFVKEFEGLFPKDDELFFKSLNFFGVIGRGVSLFGIFAFELLHFFPNAMEMTFVGEEKLGIMALDDGVDFFLNSVDVANELMMVFVDLLFMGEFFALCNERVFTFFDGVGSDG